MTILYMFDPNLQILKLVIYSRWEELVYNNTNPGQELDGNYGSQPAPPRHIYLSYDLYSTVKDPRTDRQRTLGTYQIIQDILIYDILHDIRRFTMYERFKI